MLQEPLNFFNAMKTLDVATALLVALSGGGLHAQDSTSALDWTLIYARPATG